MATGGYRFEVDYDRQQAGNGPVVRYEVQEPRGGVDSGERCHKVWSDTPGLEEAKEAYRTVRSFTRDDVGVRLVKITTEVIDG